MREVTAMRREFLLYGAMIAVFGAVVLWAAGAPWGTVAIAGVLGGAMLFITVFLGRPAPVVLLVGERLGEHLEPLHRALGDAGFDVEVCPGPENGPCPAEHGKPCPAVGRPVAAVIVRHPDDAMGLAPCGQALTIPELAVEAGSDRAPEFQGRYARVGIAKGPQAVTEALDRLLAKT
jgi:hypothetical protein